MRSESLVLLSELGEKALENEKNERNLGAASSSIARIFSSNSNSEKKASKKHKAQLKRNQMTSDGTRINHDSSASKNQIVNWERGSQKHAAQRDDRN